MAVVDIRLHGAAPPTEAAAHVVAPRGMTVVAAEAASHQTAVADFPRGATPTIVHSIPAQGTARLVPVKDILLHHGADLMRAVTEDHHIDQYVFDHILCIFTCVNDNINLIITGRTK